MRLVSWNILAGGGSRCGAIVTRLERCDADIIVLQETLTSRASDLCHALGRAGYAHRFSAPRGPVAPRLLGRGGRLAGSSRHAAVHQCWGTSTRAPPASMPRPTAGRTTRCSSSSWRRSPPPFARSPFPLASGRIARMPPKELTLRALVLGALITTVFTAANVYLGLKVGLTVRLVDPRRGDLDGDPERGQGLVDPREQHRPDRGVGGRHALGDHLRAAGTRDRRLVDRIPVLAVVSHLRERRRARGAVHDPAPARARHQLRPALPRRRRRGRGAEGRVGHARRDEGRDGRSARRAHRRRSSARSRPRASPS